MLFFLSCGGTQDSDSLADYSRNAERQFQKAMEEFDDEDCATADVLFSEVRKEFPFSRFAVLSELRLADCQFIQENYGQAAIMYKQFVKIHQRVGQHNLPLDSPNCEIKLARRTDLIVGVVGPQSLEFGFELAQFCQFGREIQLLVGGGKTFGQFSRRLVALRDQLTTFQIDRRQEALERRQPFRLVMQRGLVQWQSCHGRLRPIVATLGNVA